MLRPEELRQRSVGVGGEQPDHLLVERQDLDLELLGREAHDDVVALQRAEACRNRILRRETDRRGRPAAQEQQSKHLCHVARRRHPPRPLSGAVTGSGRPIGSPFARRSALNP